MRRALPGLALSLSVLAFADCATSAPELTPSHVAAIQDSVRTALAEFRRYSAAAQWDSVAGLYSTDSGFRWIEDGTRSDRAVLQKTLSALPKGMRVETTYDSTDVAALGPGVAVLTTYYHTQFVGASPPVQFGGAISMVWIHEPGGWRIRSGHSSSARAHATG